MDNYSDTLRSALATYYMSKDVSEFENTIGITFEDKNLLKEAFTHRSYLNENTDIKTPHNERLEFLGDAVLELSVTDWLYRKFPDVSEGVLTAYRAALVNSVTLSRVANTLSLGDHLFLSRGEAKDNGKARQDILANAFEALVGAIYLDRGYRTADEFIIKVITPLMDEIIRERLWQDSKSHFQEKAQEHTGITPSYQILSEHGPDHDKEFEVGAYIGTELIAKGKGRSKQLAEQEAAQAALEKKQWD